MNCSRAATSAERSSNTDATLAETTSWPSFFRRSQRGRRSAVGGGVRGGARSRCQKRRLRHGVRRRGSRLAACGGGLSRQGAIREGTPMGAVGGNVMAVGVGTANRPPPEDARELIEAIHARTAPFLGIVLRASLIVLTITSVFSVSRGSWWTYGAGFAVTLCALQLHRSGRPREAGVVLSLGFWGM